MTVPILFPAIATWLAVALYMILVWRTGVMRDRHGIVAPAVTGHPDFERAYRVQMNTLEQLVPFLPMLWLFAILLNGDGLAGLACLVAPVSTTRFRICAIRRSARRA
jgi:glutathione S-transferase